MSEQDGSATLRRWERKIEKAKTDDEKAQKDMKAVISAAMKNNDTKRNIAIEMKNARYSGQAPHRREGYGDDGELITGYNDDRPWERD